MERHPRREQGPAVRSPNKAGSAGGAGVGGRRARFSGRHPASGESEHVRNWRSSMAQLCRLGKAPHPPVSHGAALLSLVPRPSAGLFWNGPRRGRHSCRMSTELS